MYSINVQAFKTDVGTGSQDSAGVGCCLQTDIFLYGPHLEFCLASETPLTTSAISEHILRPHHRILSVLRTHRPNMKLCTTVPQEWLGILCYW